MTDFATLRAQVMEDAKGITVDRLDLAELLAAYDALQNKSAKSGTKYTPEFDEAWSLYPSRPGASKAATFKAWAARLKAGATALEMIEGTAKYAAFCKAERTEVAYIKQPATFYGPGEHFTADWTVRKALAPVRGRGEPAPETDEARAARRNRWGMGGLEQGDGNAAK
jgi:hypothetical protein